MLSLSLAESALPAWNLNCNACMCFNITVHNCMSLIQASLFTDHYLQSYQSCIKLPLRQTVHFLLLLLRIKCIQMAKYQVAFIVKQLQKIQCIGH